MPARYSELSASVASCADDVTTSFARSDGAGGQNVNKVNTKVDMRLSVGKSTWLDKDMKDSLQCTLVSPFFYQINEFDGWPVAR